MRLYRALLHLYPASFRAEYGAEMCALFRRRAAGAGGPALVGLWLAALCDVVPNAALVHGDYLRQDLRQALRHLRRAPGFAATALLVVALGVGANTAAFSLADFVLVRPLPFPRPDRLVKLWESTPTGWNQLSPAEYRDWKEASTSFSGFGAFTEAAVNLVGEGEPRRLRAARITPDLLAVLGVRPALGRAFDPGSSNEEGDRTVLLSYPLWQGQFAGDPSIAGRTVSLDSTPHVVVGVMPRDFRFPGREVDLWTPLTFRETDFQDRTDTYLVSVARLADDVTLEQARTELAAVTAGLERRYPESSTGIGARLLLMKDEVSPESRLLLAALCGAALCTLLLACANLANLLIVRAAEREREMAVRTAIGAGRGRLVRQMITESLALAVAGGALGVVTAYLTLPLLARLVPSSLPIADRPALDFRVLTLAGLLTAITGLGFGVVPALRASRSAGGLGSGGFGGLGGPGLGTRAGGGRRQRVRAVLVAAEVAASAALLVVAGLLLRATWRIQDVDPGFRTAGVLTLRTALPWPRYAEVAPRQQFYDRVLSEVRALPGVSRAAYATGLPMAMTGGIWPVEVPGRPEAPDHRDHASLRFVTSDYFATLDIPLRAGRDVEDADAQDRPYVAVISESFARRYWPGQEPLGKTFTFAFTPRTVVGVVGDVRVRGPERASEPQVYLPAAQVGDGSLIAYPPKELVVRAGVPPETLLPAIRRIVRAVDPDQPVSDVRTLDEVVADQTASRRAQLRVLGALAAVALLLAGVGVHGLLAFAVSRRGHEIGVRRAFGAPSPSIVRMVLGEGALLAVAGVVPGIALACGAGRAMRALLAGVEPTDPATIGTALALCLVMTLVGSLLPALRALRLSPLDAVRGD